ncbi:unnamed protein product [Rotaria magnacalcarata]|uniref:V-SNARE coiled-coil homology domain-containing protein n=1 Tax=Rotaria magnacalcarata TaxID=392030 RepID=A0A8S2JNU0_9BILA|nr:unnamed protein product [Rotaria magnacalcarata]
MSDPVDNKTNNLNALRADVTETTNVLRVTVEKLVDRGDRLDALNARAEDLNSSSYHFHGSARRIQRTMKWRNYKITIFISKPQPLYKDTNLEERYTKFELDRILEQSLELVWSAYGCGSSQLNEDATMNNTIQCVNCYKLTCFTHKCR